MVQISKGWPIFPRKLILRNFDKVVVVLICFDGPKCDGLRTGAWWNGQGGGGGWGGGGQGGGGGWGGGGQGGGGGWGGGNQGGGGQGGRPGRPNNGGGWGGDSHWVCIMWSYFAPTHLLGCFNTPLEHTPKPLPTDFKGIPFIVG